MNQEHASQDPAFTALWEAHRRRMLDLAFRMLLDFPEAEDAVQEAFTRLASAGLANLDDPEGWLVVVTSRLCLDRLRTRRRHPASPLDLADDPFDPHALDPSHQVTLVDNVTMAMHALLERLSPAERTSFVLHDVFQYSFTEVATVVGRSPASCRQLASRARRRVRADSAGRFPVDSVLHRQVSERFIEACAGGDLEGLLALLDPAVDGAGDIVPDVLVGAAEVAPQIMRYLGPPASPTLLHLPVGDRIGIVALRGRRVAALVLLTVEDGRIAHIDALAGAGPRAAVSAALGLRPGRESLLKLAGGDGQAGPGIVDVAGVGPPRPVRSARRRRGVPHAGRQPPPPPAGSCRPRPVRSASRAGWRDHTFDCRLAASSGGQATLAGLGSGIDATGVLGV